MQLLRGDRFYGRLGTNRHEDGRGDIRMRGCKGTRPCAAILRFDMIGEILHDRLIIPALIIAERGAETEVLPCRFFEGSIY